MMAGDEFYPDDVTSGFADEPEPCPVAVAADWDDGRWVIEQCGKPGTGDDDRCEEHSLA